MESVAIPILYFENTIGIILSVYLGTTPIEYNMSYSQCCPKYIIFLLQREYSTIVSRYNTSNVVYDIYYENNSPY